LRKAAGDETKAENIINKEGYEVWLMVVDESGKVVDITKLDEFGNALLKAGKPVKIPVN
jgi:hypothetical protein